MRCLHSRMLRFLHAYCLNMRAFAVIKQIIGLHRAHLFNCFSFPGGLQIRGLQLCLISEDSSPWLNSSPETIKTDLLLLHVCFHGAARWERSQMSATWARFWRKMRKSNIYDSCCSIESPYFSSFSRFWWGIVCKFTGSSQRQSHSEHERERYRKYWSSSLSAAGKLTPSLYLNKGRT